VFFFGFEGQIKLATRQLVSARRPKYSLSYPIVTQNVSARLMSRYHFWQMSLFQKKNVSTQALVNWYSHS